MALWMMSKFGKSDKRWMECDELKNLLRQDYCENFDLSIIR